MLANPLIHRTLITAAEAAALYILSRLLFVWVLQAFATRHHGGGPVLKFLRLPGNAVHEFSHALGYLVGGYTVRQCQLCIFDNAGRGSCIPGRQWAPVALPWLATGFAAIMPLVGGVLVLKGCSGALGVQLAAPQAAAHGLPETLVGALTAALSGLDFHAWQTYVFIYLGFSVGSELAPSSIDLRRSLPALLITSLGFILSIVAFSHLAASSAARQAFEHSLDTALGSVASLLQFGLLATGLVAALTFLPAGVVRAMRG